MKNEPRIVLYQKIIPSDTQWFLGADIGGTNSNFGVFSNVDTHHPVLLFSLHYKSQLITNFIEVVKDVLAYCNQQHNVTITKACFAAAGIISLQKESVKPTNLPFTIYKKDIIQNTSLKTVLLVNDFAVIGYGIDALAKDQLLCINKGNTWSKANKIIIGAGTGLGKCIMMWDLHNNRYMPSASEGGHADCSVHTPIEFQLLQHIQKHGQNNYPVSWEDLLSGNGIQRIYQFFHHTDGLAYDGLANAPHPDEIFFQKERDRSCQETVELYTRIYARCAKNFALDALAFGGVYIAGGIAAKNKELFQSPLFLQEFTLNNKQANVLAEIPIYVIVDYNVSLYGAVRYLYLM